MSANDYLEICKVGKEYVILHKDADTCEGYEIKRLTSLKKAIKWAQDYSYENLVEYGIQFSGV